MIAEAERIAATYLTNGELSRIAWKLGLDHDGLSRAELATVLAEAGQTSRTILDR